MAVIAQNRRLLEMSGIQGPYYAKAVLRNIWRRIPFIDTKLFIDFIESHGMPVIQYETEYTPPGKTFDNLVKLRDIGDPNHLINKKSEDSSSQDDEFDDLAEILLYIFNGLGLPGAALFDEIESKKEENSLWKATQRVAAVSSWRNSINS